MHFHFLDPESADIQERRIRSIPCLADNPPLFVMITGRGQLLALLPTADNGGQRRTSADIHRNPPHSRWTEWGTISVIAKCSSQLQYSFNGSKYSSQLLPLDVWKALQAPQTIQKPLRSSDLPLHGWRQKQHQALEPKLNEKTPATYKNCEKPYVFNLVCK